jgi:c-di-GMP-binding flagellar brake protein YcgR
MQGSDQSIEASNVLEPTQFSQEEKNESFRIHSEIDILFFLREIIQANSLIALYPGHENSFILTSILAIDSEKKEMIIDYGANEKINQLALQSKEIIFVTTQNKVKIEFVCNRISKIDLEGRNAFVVNIPNSLLRIQRRDNFRISTPITKPLKCIIPIIEENKSSKIEVTLLDISCGGIGVIDQHTVINFEPGITYTNCQITLPEIGIVNTAIKVKNTHAMKLHSGITCKRVGCEFIDLPARTEAMIQRYIVKQEQMRKRK